MKIKINEKMTYIVLIINIALIIFGLNSTPLILLAFLISTIMIILCPSLHGYIYLFSLLPFASVFKISGLSTSLYTFLSFILIFKSAILTKKHSIPIYLSIFLLFMYSIFISGFGFLDSLKTVISILLIYFFFIYYNESNNKDKIIIWLIKSVTITFILSSFISYFIDYFPSLNYFISNLPNYDFNDQRFQGLETDPNYYTTINIMLLIGLICLFMNKKINIFFYFSYLLLAIFGFMTLSKSFLLTFSFISIFMLFLFLKFSFMKPFLLFLSIIVISFFFGLLSNEVNQIIARFGTNINDSTTGRIELWITYLSYILGNYNVFLFGTGISKLQPYNDVHNIFIEIIFNIGIIGFLFYVFTLGMVLKISYFKNKTNKIILNFMPLCLLFVLFFFLNGFLFIYLPFFIILSFILINYPFTINRFKKTNKRFKIISKNELYKL